MKFSDQTLTILRNFSAINPSIRFKEGNVLRTISVHDTILARAELDDAIDSPFCIYDLSRFLGVVSMFEDPEFEIHEKHMVIKGAGRHVNYTFAEPELLKLPTNKDIDINDGAELIEFELKNEHLKEIIKALGVLGLPDLAIIGDGKRIKLRATDIKNKDSDLYDIDIAKTKRTFSAIFKAENMRLLPQDFNVQINPGGVVYFKGKGVEYWICLEDSSTF